MCVVMVHGQSMFKVFLNALFQFCVTFRIAVQDEKKKNKKKGKTNRSLNRSHSTTTTTTTQEWVKNLPHRAKVRKSLRISPQNVKHPPFTSALRHPTEHPTGRLQSKYQEQKEGVILILVSCGTFLQSTFHSLAGHRQTMTLH